MEEKILIIMKEVFGIEDIDETCSQRTCEKWDSMAHLNLVLELEDEFGISLEPEEIGIMTSFETVCQMVAKKAEK
ncbi:MAG: acyl carrier protein [Bacteroidales bacterium]|nr:acyl carrier protein [Bacteroidales bacterium]